MYFPRILPRFQVNVNSVLEFQMHLFSKTTLNAADTSSDVYLEIYLGPHKIKMEFFLTLN